MAQLTIGKLADATGVGIETIRYYERCHVLPTPERTSAGYRVYGSENVRQLKFVKEAQSLGFTLKEIRELLELSASPAADCAAVNKIARDKIEQIDGKLALLTKIKQNLEVLANYCPGNDQPLQDCSIINHLYGD
ncbi:heavy metal-responsive transcriptional regulator [Kordiimonas sp.]|uniref:heavy metal-responsive transcriptional regulator n=1 Tax=Kordiimonas sp. TaxID=1970157 RepID=UPI003A91D04E